MAITQNGALKRDDNDQPVMGGTSSADNATIINSAFDPVTRRLLTDSAGGGTGTVTTVSVVSANGLAGTVANPTTTPAITLSTTITGVLKGDGTSISAASSSTDYAANAFKTIAVSGQSDVVADSPIDTLTLVAGTNITITTNAGTDTITINSSGGGASGITIGTTTITSGTNTRILYNNSGVVGEYTLSGTGTVVAMATSPSFTTPTLGAATATTINGNTFTTGTYTLTGAAAKTLTFSNSLTLAGTDATTMTFPTTSATIARTDAAQTFTGVQTFVAPILGTPTSVTLTNATGLPIGGITGLGTGVGTALAVNVGSAGAFITFNGALGTPSSGTLTNATGLPISGLVSSTSTALGVGSIELGAASDTTIARVSAGVISVEGVTVDTISAANTLTNKTLTSPIIQTAPVLAAATNLKFTVPTSDTTATGITTNEFNSGYSSTAIGDLVYLDSSGTWQKADADLSAAAYSSLLGVALTVTASGAAATVLLQGFVYAATPFPTFTIGAPIYMSATAGAVTQTAPVTTDSATRIIGFAVHADKMWFNPSNDYITHV